MEAGIRVVLVDDHPVVREGLRGMLSHDPRIEVVGEAGSGQEAIELVSQLEPDIALVDIRMPGMSGIEAIRRIKAQRASTAVIVLTMYESRAYVVESLRAGAAGYVVKDCSREFLCHAINAVRDGCTMVRSDLLRQAIQGLPGTPRELKGDQADPAVMERFTVRELEVLRLVTQGYLNKEISRELNLAESTVKKYVQSVIAKLGVSDRTNAAIIAVRLGMAE